MSGDLVDDRAYMWRALDQTLHDRRQTSRRALRFSIFHDRYGPIQPDTFREFAARAQCGGNPLPPLMFSIVHCDPLGHPIPDTPATEQARALLLEHGRNIMRRVREDNHDQGYDENRAGEHTPGSEIIDHDGAFARRFLYAFFRLCDQRIAVEHPAEVSHSARATAQRARTSPDVSVVELRTAGSRPAAERATTDWNHRWVVRMHKVRQWYPSEQCHKVIYRGPYFKGPQDKPLLSETTKVHGLTR